MITLALVSDALAVRLDRNIFFLNSKGIQITSAADERVCVEV